MSRLSRVSSDHLTFYNLGPAKGGPLVYTYCEMLIDKLVLTPLKPTVILMRQYEKLLLFSAIFCHLVVFF